MKALQHKHALSTYHLLLENTIMVLERQKRSPMSDSIAVPTCGKMDARAHFGRVHHYAIEQALIAVHMLTSSCPWFTSSACRSLVSDSSTSHVRKTCMKIGQGLVLDVLLAAQTVEACNPTFHSPDDMSCGSWLTMIESLLLAWQRHPGRSTYWRLVASWNFSAMTATLLCISTVKSARAWSNWMEFVSIWASIFAETAWRADWDHSWYQSTAEWLPMPGYCCNWRVKKLPVGLASITRWTWLFTFVEKAWRACSCIPDTRPLESHTLTAWLTDWRAVRQARGTTVCAPVHLLPVPLPQIFGQWSDPFQRLWIDLTHCQCQEDRAGLQVKKRLQSESRAWEWPKVPRSIRQPCIDPAVTLSYMRKPSCMLLREGDLK